MFKFVLLFFTILSVNSLATQELPRDKKSLEAENERLRSEVRELKKEKEELIKKNNSEKKKAEESSEALPDSQERNNSEEDFFKLEENIVTTVSKKEQKVSDAPAAIYVITEKQIRERGYRSLVDALSDIPGFDIIHNYGIFPELIHQRGLVGNNQRTLLYIDGIPDNNLTEGAILGGSIRFPLNNVQRIEVVSGPASALYGANAFNGIINIITKDGKSNPGNHVDITHGYWEGNFRNPGTAMSFSTRNTTSMGVGYSIGGYYYNTQGPYFGDTERLDKPNVNPNDAAYALEKKACGGTCTPDGKSVGAWWSPGFNVANVDTYNMTAKFSFKDLRFETVNWQYLQGRGTFDNGTVTVDTKQRGFDTGATDSRNWARLLGWTNYGVSPVGLTGNQWSFKNNSTATGYAHRLSKTMSLDSELISRQTEIVSSSHEESYKNPGPYAYYKPGNITLLNSYSRPDYAYELKEKFLWDISKTISVVAGVEAQHVVVPAAYGSDRRFTYTTYGSYAQMSYKPISILTLTAGYRYDYNTFWGKYQTPRLSAILNISKDLTLKFLLGSGFRAPTAWEMFNATQSRKANSDIKPERLRSAEIGIGYRFLKNFYTSAAIYYNTLSNLILEVATNEANTNLPGTNWNQNQNIASAKIYGSEIILDAQILDSLKLNLGFTHNKGEYLKLSSKLTSSPSTDGRTGDNYPLDIFNAVTNNKFVPTSGNIPNIANNKMSVGITYYALKNLSTHIGLNYVDIRRTIATNPEKTVQGYGMWKTNIRWEDAFWINGMYLQFEVFNATNQQFFDPGIRVASGSKYPTMHPLEKRNIWLTIGYKF
ncbi:MAG TPA: TonB-dependent receptor [Leptospiraceae bacterium]|nr:TonB-dependent receptor [Leptospiraceae bacterium]HRG73234.1 TonB-dependent receptor [Leptospiraceae bacterium]